MGFRTSKTGRMAGALLAAALVAVVTAPARAQIIYDGNIFWNNGATPGSLSAQFVGSPGAGAGCAVGYTTEQLATVSYPDNSFVNPYVPSSAYAGNPGFDTTPDFQPAGGSPAYAGNPGHGKVVDVPNDGFFERVCYVGAVGPRPTDRWWEGWTYFSQDGVGRTDVNLSLPLVIVDNHKFYVNRTFTPDTLYLLRGSVRVKDQATLTLLPGTVVLQEKTSVGTLVVERGGKLVSNGTPEKPIVITSEAAGSGPQTPGGGGGVFLNGYARVNVFSVCGGDSVVSEGGNGGVYGGTNDADDSGSIRYTRIEFAGVVIFAANESNSLTMNGVGNGTTIEYVQCHRGLDDNFEFFGGDTRVKHLVSSDGDDDGYDWQLGSRGKAQFLIVRQNNATPTGGTSTAEKGIEADNDNTASGTRRDSVSCSGRSHHVVANFTFIGDRRTGGGSTPAGIHLREGTASTILNGITVDFKGGALNIQHDPTWKAHCTAIPAAPAIACNGSSAGVPVAEGTVFIAQGRPNPFRNEVAFRFSLDAPSRVRVDVFAADGRLVQTLADRDMIAGPQTVAWSVGRQVPAGVYFYRVTTASSVSSGKVTRID